MTDTTSNPGGAASAVPPSRVVYKYRVEITGLVLTLDAPRIVLAAHDRNEIYDGPTVWIEHERTTSEDHARHSRIEVVFVPTGLDVPDVRDGWHHAGSCQCSEFVWHVYQRTTMLLSKEVLFGTLVQS